MKKLFPCVLLFTILLSACSDDGIPEVNDVNNIVVHGEKMSRKAFMEKYCQGVDGNKSCAKIIAANSDDALNKPGVTNW